MSGHFFTVEIPNRDEWAKQRVERIEKVCAGLNPEAEQVFRKLCADYPDASVFWDDESAELCGKGFEIIICNV